MGPVISQVGSAVYSLLGPQHYLKQLMIIQSQIIFYNQVFYNTVSIYEYLEISATISSIYLESLYS